MNSIGHEYKQIGGDYKVLHHTEYLETLVANKKLTPAPAEATITYHDPCYLGRHNGVYEAPRNLLNILSNATPELPRNRENSFCCGAGGAQFWKEEEEGDERISDNRFREAQQTLATAAGETSEKILAVGCPFCKSMLGSTPGKAAREDIAIKDVAELLLEGVRRAKGLTTPTIDTKPVLEIQPTTQNLVILSEAPERAAGESNGAQSKDPASAIPAPVAQNLSAATTNPPPPAPERKKWQPKPTTVAAEKNPIPPSTQETIQPLPKPTETQAPPAATPERKKWQPKTTATTQPTQPETPTANSEQTPAPSPEPTPPSEPQAPARKKWQPKKPD
jgi:hypothetical protein